MLCSHRTPYSMLRNVYSFIQCQVFFSVQHKVRTQSTQSTHLYILLQSSEITQRLCRHFLTRSCVLNSSSAVSYLRIRILLISSKTVFTSFPCSSTLSHHNVTSSNNSWPVEWQRPPQCHFALIQACLYGSFHKNSRSGFKIGSFLFAASKYLVMWLQRFSLVSVLEWLQSFI